MAKETKGREINLDSLRALGVSEEILASLVYSSSYKCGSDRCNGCGLCKNTNKTRKAGSAMSEE